LITDSDDLRYTLERAEREGVRIDSIRDAVEGAEQYQDEYILIVPSVRVDGL